MNIDTLKMFIMITQKGSISAAANELGYAQSNISTKVHQLEDELNTQLFYRNNRGITLTESGQELLKQAIKIVGLTDQTISSIQHPKEVRGKLQIGSLQTAASTFLPEILSKYHDDNPNVELIIKTGTTSATTQMVLDYKLDGAIIGGKIIEDDLTSISLMNEELCLITAKSKQDNLQNSPLLVFPVGCAYRKTLESWLDSQQIMMHQSIEFNYLNAIIASVSAGLGISILPKRVVQPYVDSGSITTLELPEPFSTLPISFIYRKDHIISHSFESFIKNLK